MTLQNGLVHGGSAWLWTDTAYYDVSSGALVGFASKAMEGLEWPWAGIISIIGGFPYDIASAIGHAYPSDMHELASATADALRAHAAKGYIGRVLLAGWQDAPYLCLVSTDEAGGAPFEPCYVEHYLNAGNHLPSYHRALKRGLNPKRMARVIDEQIANPVALAGPAGEAGQLSQYGGNVVEIEVAPDGVKSRVLRTIHETAEAA